MELVIQTGRENNDLWKIPRVKTLLQPYHPVISADVLCLDDKCFHYLTLNDHAPVQKLIGLLMEIKGIKAAYQKPLDFPPM
ncbi:hypothetical protein [Zobellia uliginosa]|uniref:hypothetical protein n=1 Tax=Zobellia uliginosa TaxID=143224 RepID=UPI001C07A702|nr:hypothetical protein [Zobellia uliginosa]MBU2947391.1 hypothetical protein [Zobellia uliginosa]